MTRSSVAMVLNTIGLGGVPEVVLHLMRRLAKDEFTRFLYVLKEPKDEGEARATRQAILEESGVEVTFAKFRAGRAEGITELADWIVARDIAILHTHSYRPNLYARVSGALCRPRGLRVIAHYHNHYGEKWDADPAALSLERHLVASTDAMIAVSRQCRAHVAERLGIDETGIDVVENGVDADRFAGQDRAVARKKLQLPSQALLVGLLGRICQQKGQDDFVEVAAALHPRFPEAQFVMFGDFEDQELYNRLVARVAKLGLNHVVLFAGHVTDVPLVYAALDVVAVPSRWEGFPLVVAEAQAAGRALVATRVGAIPDMVDDGASGLLVPPGDLPAFAGALARVLGDSMCREALGRAGRMRAREFSWERAAETTAGIYRRILSQPRG